MDTRGKSNGAGFSEDQIRDVFATLGLSDGTTTGRQLGNPTAPPSQPLNLTLSAHSVIKQSD